MTELEKLAGMIAMEAPFKPSKRTVYVRAELIERIRNEMTKRGYDWKAAWIWTREEEDRRRKRIKAEVAEVKSKMGWV